MIGTPSANTPEEREGRDRILLGIGFIVLLAVLTVLCCASILILRITTPVNASGPKVLLPPFANYEAWEGVAPFPLGQEAIKSKEGDLPGSEGLFDPCLLYTSPSPRD